MLLIGGNHAVSESVLASTLLLAARVDRADLLVSACLCSPTKPRQHAPYVMVFAAMDGASGKMRTIADHNNGTHTTSH